MSITRLFLSDEHIIKRLIDNGMRVIELARNDFARGNGIQDIGTVNSHTELPAEETNEYPVIIAYNIAGTFQTRLKHANKSFEDSPDTSSSQSVPREHDRSISVDFTRLNQLFCHPLDRRNGYPRSIVRVVIGHLIVTISDFNTGPTVITGPLDNRRLHAVGMLHRQMTESLLLPSNANGRMRDSPSDLVAGYRVSQLNITVTNTVVSARVPFYVDVLALFLAERQDAKYNPVQFPGVVLNGSIFLRYAYECRTSKLMDNTAFCEYAIGIDQSDALPTIIIFDTGAIIVYGLSTHINTTRVWTFIGWLTSRYKAITLDLNAVERTNRRRKLFSDAVEVDPSIECNSTKRANIGHRTKD